ncbi:MAG: M4 family metallopeptidase [Lachnospiraceae bacterium]|nr:M4 family metallopeptidase [Lachnospiraceae bacterium]
MKKRTVVFLIILFAVLNLLTICILLYIFLPGSTDSSSAEESSYTDEITTESSQEDSSGQDDSGQDRTGSDSYPSSDISYSSDDSSIQGFIGEPFYEGVVDEVTALDAVYSISDRIADGKDIDLEIFCIDGPNNEGMYYYTFRQVADNITVYGATVKLIVDKDNRAIGLVSSLYPEIGTGDTGNWRIDAETAESIVTDEFGDKAQVIKSATEQVLLPSEDSPEDYYYTWAVYTNNFEDDYDSAYLVHYVDASGEYLYSLPISRPGNDEALSGATATFSFDNMEPGEWSGTIRTLKGDTRSVTVPVMTDKETGETILGDAERKILCADYNAFYDEESISYLVSNNNSWDDRDIMTYYNYIRVYDFYADTGWVGPDGVETPSLLLMNAVDSDGEPLNNASYDGKMEGFQVFSFGTEYGFGDCLDVVGHEFTHCFTTYSWTNNIYLNDYGAINEAMSDIMGNLVAMMVDENDIPFEIGENSSDGTVRYMGDPHKGEQPEFVWDTFYIPNVAEATENNDNGGVHYNSSLINLLSYNLNKAGMDPVDEFYFWMNASYVMTPRTDFAQISQILPWVLDNLGYADYKDVLDQTIADTKVRDKALPTEAPDGYSMIRIPLPETDYLKDHEVLFFVESLENFEVYEGYVEVGTNAITITVSPGESALYATSSDTDENYACAVYMNDSWKAISEEELESYLGDENNASTLSFNIGEGAIIELDGDSLIDVLRK